MQEYLAAVMRHIRNYFERGRIDGVITITGGVVSPAVASPYVCIVGSAYHDGVHAVTGGAIDSALPDETFDGRVWLLYPPREIIQLAAEIAAFDATSPAGAMISESLGEYSYTRAHDWRTGGAATWETVFDPHLRPHMRMFTEVRG